MATYQFLFFFLNFFQNTRIAFFFPCVGKVEVTGVEEILGHKAFVLRFLQCRDEDWIGRPFFAKYDPDAVWFDDLEPLPGMELPWDENGIPKPVISALN